MREGEKNVWRRGRRDERFDRRGTEIYSWRSEYVMIQAQVLPCCIDR
jgi:hypothetical protein